MKSSIHLSSNNSSNNRMAIVWSVVVHLILVGLLLWGALWTPPQPVEAELWDSASLASAMNQEPATELEVPVTEPEENEVNTPIVETKKSEEPADIETKPTPKTLDESKIKPVAQPPSRAPSTQPEKTNNKPQTNDKARDILSKVTGGTGSKPGVSNSGKGNEDYASYIALVKRAIESNARDLKGKSLTVLINVSSSGQVLNKRVIRSSGDSAWDQLLLSRIPRLPQPPLAAQNNQLTVIIKP